MGQSGMEMRSRLRVWLWSIFEPPEECIDWGTEEIWHVCSSTFLHAATGLSRLEYHRALEEVSIAALLAPPHLPYDYSYSSTLGYHWLENVEIATYVVIFTEHPSRSTVNEGGKGIYNGKSQRRADSM